METELKFCCESSVMAIYPNAEPMARAFFFLKFVVPDAEKYHDGNIEERLNQSAYSSD